MRQLTESEVLAIAKRIPDKPKNKKSGKTQPVILPGDRVFEHPVDIHGKPVIDDQEFFEKSFLEKLVLLIIRGTLGYFLSPKDRDVVDNNGGQ